MKRLLAKLACYFGRHQCYVDDLERRDAYGFVHCRCSRCGKRLAARYGLGLDAHLIWEKKPR